MRNDKHIAIKLRKKGKSYNEISKELGLSKSTISNWLSNEQWSKIIKQRLEQKARFIAKKRLLKIIKKRSAYWEQWRDNFRQSARNNFPKLIKNPLFVSGISLYWGEGDHNLKNGMVVITNTDPKIIFLFSKFLREVVKIPSEKIFAWIFLYPDLSEKSCKNFWSKNSGILVSQFKKSKFIKGKHPTKKSAYGICSVVVFSRGLKEQIFVWKDLLHKKYSN